MWCSSNTTSLFVFVNAVLGKTSKHFKNFLSVKKNIHGILQLQYIVWLVTKLIQKLPNFVKIISKTYILAVSLLQSMYLSYQKMSKIGVLRREL